MPLAKRSPSKRPQRGHHLGDREFELLRRLIYSETGIVLALQKREMLSSRLARRLRHYGFSDYRQYCDYLRSGAKRRDERRELVNCVTTNKTHFFREAHHFDFLREQVVEPLLRSGKRKLRIWSAGCSTGEEPYSIALTVLDSLGSSAGWDIRILASDIDTQVLAHAERAVYPRAALQSIPVALQKRWLQSTGADDFKIQPAVRDLVTFRPINFVKQPWPIKTTFDVIFCRNVVIYFDRETQKTLYTRFCELLRPGGYLVAGHSESLSWMAPLLTPVGRTVYRTRQDAPALSTRGARPRPPVSVKPPAPRVPRSSSQKPSLPRRSGRPLSERPRSIPTVRIHSGELHVATKPTRVTTLLGSCVAACLFDAKAGIGGMNHFMLPEQRDPSDIRSIAFGVNAMELLINKLLQSGAQRDRLRARVFGASHVLRGVRHGEAVARANAEFVREFLRREGIVLLEAILQGDSPLQVSLNTHTGQCTSRRLNEDSARRAALNEDQAQLERITSAFRAARSDDAVLF